MSVTPDPCPVCGAQTIEKKLKRFCTRCGQLCETCCDTGSAQDYSMNSHGGGEKDAAPLP